MSAPVSPARTLALVFALAAFSAATRAAADAPASDASATSASALESAWRDASLGLFKDALSAFQDASGPEARYGEALALLLRQPKTAGNIDRAAALLAELAAAAPDTEVGVAARYQLGRVEQVHRVTPDPVAARRIFSELVAAHPDHPLAQRAVVKLALLDLYERVPETVRRERFDAYAARSAELGDRGARRDLCLLLADTAQRFAYPPGLVLDLLLRADEAGVARRAEQASLCVRIGRLAADAGRPEIARRYLERFLAAYQRDSRRLMIEQQLAALPAPVVAIAEAAR